MTFVKSMRFNSLHLLFSAFTYLCRMRVCVRAAAPPAVGSSQRWQVSLYTSTPSIRSVLPTNQPSKPPSDIRLSFVDRQSGNKRDSVNVGGWAAEKWRRDDDERMTGLKRTGQVDLTNIQPGAVLVQKLDSDGGYPDVDLVSYVELTRYWQRIDPAGGSLSLLRMHLTSPQLCRQYTACSIHSKL